jgi:hypothetical protein
MAKTKAQLATSVLRKMRIVDAVENPSASDSELVETAYDAKTAAWRRLGYIWWPNTGRLVQEIPDEVFDVMVRLISNSVSDDYGMPRQATEEAAEKMLLREVRALNHKPDSGESTWFCPY